MAFNLSAEVLLLLDYPFLSLLFPPFELYGGKPVQFLRLFPVPGGEIGDLAN